MIWPWRALLGPGLWALAFAAIYAAHGLGCALGWPARELGIGSLHSVVLVALWLLALGAAAAILRAMPRGRDRGARIARAGGWIGLISILFTLFPVLGASSCPA